MRTSALALTIVLGCAASGSQEVTLTDDGIADAKADAPTTASALTSAQARTVLGLIDDACGDAWCEGDYNYAFKRFTCKTASPSSCTLTVVVIDEGDPTAGTQTRNFWRSCKIPGFTKLADIVDTAANGFNSITDSYWNKLDDCMGKIESSIPAR